MLQSFKLMKRIYETGEDANSIVINVSVGTVGTAYSAVYLVRSGGQQTKLAESNVSSGSIEKRKIGSARELRNAYLQILTYIDFTSVNEKDRKSAIDNLSVRYIMSGGFSGHQIYNQDTDDTILMPNGKVMVTKPIELK